MTKPRTTLISLEATAYYHCVSRRVRRAFLCGEDHATGRSFEHRRAWIEERLLALGRVFALDVCAYAVMANHNHLVLPVDEALAASWSERAVIERWHVLFQGTCQYFVQLFSLFLPAPAAPRTHACQPECLNPS